MNENAFFVSKGLEDLFEASQPRKKTVVMIGDSVGQFLSYALKNKRLRFEIEAANPFELFHNLAMSAQIILPSGDKIDIIYDKVQYKIEQSTKSFIITLEEMDQ